MKTIAISKVFNLFPQIKSEMKWSISDLEFFVDAYLLIGTQINDELHINIKSLEKLIDYYQSIKHSNSN